MFNNNTKKRIRVRKNVLAHIALVSSDTSIQCNAMGIPIVIASLKAEGVTINQLPSLRIDFIKRQRSK